MAALELAHAHGLETIVDLDVLPSDAIPVLGDADTLDAVLRSADVLKPTSVAARELFPEIDDLASLAIRIREHFEIGIVVMTDGARGALLCDDSGSRWIGAFSADQVVDTTGAGDAFLGGMIAGETRGLALEDAVRLGNACGAACVERLGAFPSVDASGRRALLDRIHEFFPHRL